MCFFSGLKKEVLSGEDCLKVQKAASGDEVTVHYEGTLTKDGKKFDSSLDRGEPLSFELGQNLVVPGWEQGLLDTCPGQKIKLEVPGELGYVLRKLDQLQFTFSTRHSNCFEKVIKLLFNTIKITL